MSEPIKISGAGAVSPAGWTTDAMVEAVRSGTVAERTTVEVPGSGNQLPVSRVPRPSRRPPFLAQPRVRRSSPITHYALAAAFEALGDKLSAIQGDQTFRLGIVYCAMTGCVNYSRRFYDEVLHGPETASPLLFPETVFNAPASHLAALLETQAINYTLVGDPGAFLQGVALAGTWLLDDQVDGCLVVGAEELDWLVASAQRLFNRDSVSSEGAGALYLERGTEHPGETILRRVVSPEIFSSTVSPTTAARQVRDAFPAVNTRTLLCDSLDGSRRSLEVEGSAWSDWSGPRLSVKPILGDALAASSAWQCVLAANLLLQGEIPAAIVNVVGCNEQAVAAEFRNAHST